MRGRHTRKEKEQKRKRKSRREREEEKERVFHKRRSHRPLFSLALALALPYCPHAARRRISRRTARYIRCAAASLSQTLKSMMRNALFSALLAVVSLSLAPSLALCQRRHTPTHTHATFLRAVTLALPPPCFAVCIGPRLRVASLVSAHNRSRRPAPQNIEEFNKYLKQMKVILFGSGGVCHAAPPGPPGAALARVQLTPAFVLLPPLSPAAAEEPSSEIVAQLSNEVYNTGLLFKLCVNMKHMDFEVRPARAVP